MTRDWHTTVVWLKQQTPSRRMYKKPPDMFTFGTFFSPPLTSFTSARARLPKFIFIRRGGSSGNGQTDGNGTAAASAAAAFVCRPNSGFGAPRASINNEIRARHSPSVRHPSRTHYFINYNTRVPDRIYVSEHLSRRGTRNVVNAYI